MKITKKQKKLIALNYKEHTLAELSNISGLSEQEVSQYLKKKGKTARQIIQPDLSLGYKTVKDLVKIIETNIPFLLSLLFLTALVFANSLKGDFVSDDIATYVENKDLSNFSTVLRTRQVQTLLFYISYNVFGQDPMFLHTVSIISHYIAVLVAFVLFYMKFGKKPAMIAATLFCVHPVVTEAVSWISGMNYVFNAIRTLILLILYTLYHNSEKKKFLIASVIFFLITNMLSMDPWKLVIPITMIVWDQFLLQDKIKPKRIHIFLPFFAISIFFFLWRLIPIAQDRITTLYQHPEERSPYWLTFPYTIYMTFRLMAYPDKLTLYHEGEVLTPLFFNITRVFLAVVLVTVPILIKKHRTLAGIIMIIYTTLLPALSPIQVAWFMAERYLYIGTSFFCLLVGFAFLHLENKVNKKYVASALTMILLLAYSIRTMVRNTDWRTHKSLWMATYKVSPSSPKVHNNLGDIYTRERNYDMAIYHFAKSAEISPNFDAAHFNLARTYYLTRELDEARQKFKDAIRVNPGLYQAYYMLGVMDFEDGNLEGARDYYLKALEINPKDPDTLYAMSLLTSWTEPAMSVGN